MHPGFGLDAKFIRFVAGTEHELFYCEDCGLLQFDTINKCCIAFRCQGKTKKLSDGELAQYHRKNHYIFNIENGEAQTTRACEHTASLSTELRQDIEQEFSQNKINLLSCTTTMEMGVDLGELEAIICLNIPPGISNYQQRTGRAGRRAQAAPFCVTTARNSQYDQAVFANFVEYLEQPALVPRIHLENAKLFQRHQNSVMLSGFLRAKIEDHNVNAPSIADLFGVEFDAHQYHNFKDAVYNWIESDGGQKYIQEAEWLTITLPDHIREKIALNGYALKEKFAEQLLMLAIEVRERWSLYTDKYKDAYESEKLGVAKHWQNQREKFMNQFLVTQLSSYGMIPTYSFPVNSLNLDVTKEHSTQRGFWSDKDVSLSRDAMLGIAEYAPGAEVVANGRIWTSQGLAYYPRDFMPTRYYTTCKECHHVEVGEDKADLSNVCSFCGNQSLGMKRAFIEPHGFVTAYKDRKGKDPSLHRIRKQYADEARLISLARDNQFVLSDNPVVSKAILRSHSLDPDEPIGTLCIINRGTFGMGYHHCLLCNYMMPAKKFEYKSKKHVELLGDRRCKNRHLNWPKDMAHTFNTDVCILRFNRQLPILPSNAQKSDPQRYLNAFSRTLCEALRYASATVLGLQVDVIRVTYKMSDRRLSVIIYDAVPGGAGYSARLFNESKVNDLLKAAIKRLDCPQNCSSGCRSCLCDYFNQRIWDILDRKPVLEWLQQLVLHNVEHPILRQGAVKWKNPNYHGLSERLESYNHIHLAGRTLLTNQSTYDGSAVNWLLSELNNGRLINIHLFDGLDIKKINTYQERQILNHLRPFIENGQLVIGKLDISEELDKCLRVIPEPIDGAPVFYTDFPLPAILDQIIPQPVYQLVAHDRLVTDIKDLLHASMPYKTEYFFPPSKKMQRWQLVSGVPRALTTYFDELKNAYVDNIVIKDPYCCAGESQVKSLHQFIKFLNGQVKKLKKITIQCKEHAYNNRNYQRPEEVQTKLKNALNDVLDISPTIKVIPFRYGNKFHDRIIKAVTIDNEGVETKHLYDLTGGVDFLMDNNRSTVVFYSQESD
ncbi:helicase-related protein [Desulfococcaceae bacterium HSG9]|nr:helicase-related protein [Desulfococcaceae bacterium HSG9]